ncbi:DMT family transporter [Hydrogenophaga sp.]|uniref:DMT family transporter n=1 Tax=Hydrogenophaga sp. TaxID=1904254 RepID=UPI00272018ED|nr:DMT family transporter [Hydrogenophaga sp.]MDO8906259.1 EamA family transporter [Hydrogenophaga sp.]
MNAARWPALQGGLLAALSAVLFGLTTPLLKLAGEGIGPFTTAALLYAGAAGVAWLTRVPARQEARVQRSDAARLCAMALLGAVMGPVALAWGLQHTTATSASLLLTLEAVCTIAFARWLYGEMLDRRVWAAVTLLLLGGAVLVIDQGPLDRLQGLGLAAVALATVAWGLDNALSRGVADRDPAQVVGIKASLGTVATVGLAAAAGEATPGWATAGALLALGAMGYGLSLRFYLLAQRRIGAARTGSVFAFAPFLGAAAAVLAGERAATLGMGIAAGLMLLGVVLHLAERHDHDHTHEAMEHEHAHVHGDGHHLHTHDPMPTEAHSHLHRHESLHHRHAHVPDLHHQHRHTEDR